MYLRFSNKAPEKNETSYNAFNGEELNGVCCFELNDEESIYTQIRKIARRNGNYVNNSEGEFHVFEGKFIEKNFNHVGVIVKPEFVIESGKVIMGKHGYKIA